jgi:hypothetical protein
VEVRLSGLPHASAWGRYLATLLAACIALWGIMAAARRRGEPPRRARLEQRRGELLAQLAAVDPRAGGGKAREELLGKLEKVYRELDEAGA